MPLSIEATTPVEHPDVTALKDKVREAAKKHSVRNHCGEYKSWLRQLGIDDAEEKVHVEIEFTVSGSSPQKAVQKFRVADLAGKTAEEQHTWVAEKIAPKVDVAGTKVTLPVTIIDLNKVEKPVITLAGTIIPEGYIARYASNDARVLHVIQTTEEILARSNGNSRIYSACGESSYRWSEESARSEGRVCRNCSRHVANGGDDDEDDELD